MALPLDLIALALAFIVFFVSASSKIILEEGYKVSTVVDGHKLKINPRSVLARPGSSDLLLLDSSRSHLYTISFPLSNESDVKRISSGEEKPDYQDGELSQARFNDPRSFAFDVNGNVYVADKGNHVIRKISSSGTVTTIAGGYSKTEGRKDGPSQNATFSNDFELAIVAERCMLLVVDHGSQLVRQIDLKPADCATSSPSGQLFGLRGVITWILGLFLSCLLGMVMGFLLRPFITRHGGSRSLIGFSKIWKHYLINLGKQVVILCFDFKNALANNRLYGFVHKLFRLCLSHLSLMCRVKFVETHPSLKDSVSLLDSDDLSDSVVVESEVCSDQLKDLICFDDTLYSSNASEFFSSIGDKNPNKTNVFPDCHGKIDTMIQANVIGFDNQAEETSSLVKPAGCSSGLVKRR